jgi:hypothetical protein
LPFANYADFDACVLDQQKKNDLETAKAICGKMQSELGGTNFVESTLDANGDLYLKYFIIDASLAQNTAMGEWSVTPEAIDANDHKAKRIPFAVLPSKDLSLYGDWHPWSPEPNATLEDNIEFARKYAPGYLVETTKESGILSAAVDDIKKNNGRFAIIHINDPRARDAYIKNPSLIPKAVSPGIIGNTKNGQIGVTEFDWAHLAAVPKGAFGDKATLYGKCIGPHTQCVNSLLAASVADLSKNTTYCPIGASELISSLGFSEGTNQTVMSSNTAEPAVIQSTATAPSTQPAAATPTAPGAPINVQPAVEQKSVLKLKTPVNQAPTQTVDLKEHEKLRKEFEDYKLGQEQNARKEAVKKLIPPQLFIAKGKFDENAYNAEVEKRVSQGWDDATISEHYSMKMEILKAAAQPNPLAGGYQTPSEVPLGGSAADGNDSINSTIQNLLSRFIRSEA